MRVLKPEWLTHGGEKKDFEIYSCHVSPDGKRLVTAAGDGYVRIWSTEAIYNATLPNQDKPRQLASMSNHSGTIHTVRFSPNNKYLASGADDRIVCVYNLDPNAPTHSTFGSNEAPPVENWRVFRRLIGHDNDVQDLGWSYDSSILVSVGLDSKVVVWSGYTFERLKTLKNHQSHVKGITFDPANKYFATASDDRTIKIFNFTPPAPNSTAQDNTSNFTLETTIAAPFTASPLTTYFRRCSWSPDGNHITASNAVNGPVSSVAVINRGTWESDINLIGHEGPVEVCAFSPRLFGSSSIGEINRDDKGAVAEMLVTVIACAGQDKSLSVWNTNHPRPLIVIQDLTVKTISDLAWSPDGRNLFATSLDGSIIAFVFDDGDLGYAMSAEENERALAKFGANRKGMGIIEGPDGFLLEEKSKVKERTRVEGRMVALMGDGAETAAAAAPDRADVAMTNGSSSRVNGQAATTNGQNGESGTPRQDPVKQEDPNAARLKALKQRVTITQDGKKRIAPLLLSGSSGVGESSLPKSQLMAASGSTQGASNDAPHSILDLSKPFDGLPKGGLAALLLGNRRSAAVADADEQAIVDKRLAAASRDGAVPILTGRVDGTAGLEPADTPKSVAGRVQATPEFIRPAVVNPSLSVSQVRLAVPKLRSHIVRSIDARGNISLGSNNPASGPVPTVTGKDLVLEVRNASTPSATGRAQDRDPARLVVSAKGQIVWQDYLPRSVLLISGNHHFWAAACEDGSVHVWTPAGRRLLNPLIVEAQPVILESRGWWLLCISAIGVCHVWNLQTTSSPHPPVSLAPVLDIATLGLGARPATGPAVTSASLNSNGQIIVTLNNGDAYTYSSSMFVWQRLSEAWWAVGSQYWNTTDSSVGNIQPSSDQQVGRESSDGEPSFERLSAGIIPHLERRTTNEVLLGGRGFLLQRLIKSLLSREGFEGFESNVSIAHLETRLAGALQLGARQEFRLYLYMYAKRIGAEGMKGKTQELLQGILGDGLGRGGLDDGSDDADEGGSDVNGTAKNDPKLLCGWPRRELLKGIILILGKHRDLQRITVPFSNLLKVTGEEMDSSEAMVL
ncbi:MAG: HIR complex subunit [Sarcosagium campestre]|nr:MAG: HIR complex subunit [Sarcosagium campestre]